MSKDLAELRREHVDKQRAKAHRDMAQVIFDRDGEVTSAQVDEALVDWVPPTDAEVNDRLAFMLEGEVAYHRRQAEDTSRADALRAKVEKLKGHVADTQGLLDAEEADAEERAEAARQAEQHAQALLDELRASGADSSQASTGQAEAHAEAAEVKGDS